MSAPLDPAGFTRRRLTLSFAACGRGTVAKWAAPGDTVASSRVTRAWHWLNDVNHPGSVQHAAAVSRVPTLVATAAG